MNDRTNPLLPLILDILKSTAGPLTEHQLMGRLQHALAELAGTDTGSLGLFRRHFLVMNALYQLQQDLTDTAYALLLSPLSIELQPTKNSRESLPGPDGGAALKDYYLDWRHFDNTTSADVEALLSGFWQRYVADDKQAAAYQQLQLEPGADWRAVQKNYRRLAAAAHPDRGGSSEDFISLRQAYEVLAAVLT